MTGTRLNVTLSLLRAPVFAFTCYLSPPPLTPQQLGIEDLNTTQQLVPGIQIPTTQHCNNFISFIQPNFFFVFNLSSKSHQVLFQIEDKNFFSISPVWSFKSFSIFVYGNFMQDSSSQNLRIASLENKIVLIGLVRCFALF